MVRPLEPLTEFTTEARRHGGALRPPNVLLRTSGVKSLFFLPLAVEFLGQRDGSGTPPCLRASVVSIFVRAF